MTRNSQILYVIALAVGVLLAPMVPVQARALSNDQRWQVGYDHGCSDAKISSFSDRYIAQPGKGPGDHTESFNDGYNVGLRQCGGNVLEDQPVNSPRQTQGQAQQSSSNSASSSTANANNDNKITINNFLGKHIKEHAFVDPSFFKPKVDTNFVRITLVDSPDRDVRDVRFYIKEFPQYAAPSNAPKSYTDLTDSFNPDQEKHVDKFTLDLVFPSNLIPEGDKFHVCMDEVNLPGEKNSQVICYQLTNDIGDNELTVNTGDL